MAEPIPGLEDAWRTPEERELLERIRSDVEARLSVKPRRLAHVERVCACALELSRIYEVEPFTVACAALLHDWYKDRPDIELVDDARAMGIDFGVELSLVAPLLHGAMAARALPERYPELPAEVFRAIAVHTEGAAEMSDPDMVLFVADAIEPGRPDVPSIRAIREKVGEAPLSELYFETFVSGVVYVLETGRYLYPGTIDTYNELVSSRSEKEHA